MIFRQSGLIDISEKILYKAHYGLCQVLYTPKDRVHVYFEDRIHPIHSHHEDLVSTVLLGELMEEQFSDDGKTLLATRRVKEGETYFIEAETMHRTNPTIPSVTHIKSLGATDVPVRYVAPAVIIPDNQQKKLAERIVYWPHHGMVAVHPKPEGAFHVWFEPAKCPIHNHSIDIISTVIYGELWEDQYTEDKVLLNTRHIKQGETYHIDAATMHTLRFDKYPVITRTRPSGERSKYPVMVLE